MATMAGSSQGVDNDDGSSFFNTHDNVFYMVGDAAVLLLRTVAVPIVQVLGSSGIDHNWTTLATIGHYDHSWTTFTMVDHVRTWLTVIDRD
jgi:hypothetical protein